MTGHRSGPRSIRIPFSRPHVTGRELEYIARAIDNGHLSGDGEFTRHCQQWLIRATRCREALLTHSCSGALEMIALLLDIRPGDEIIMPSFTFPSTANAFALRGGVPVFVDVHVDTLCLDEGQVEAALTARTRAIVAVHYAGVGCEMDALMTVAARHHVAVVEDAAQGVMSAYRGRPLGGIGTLAALSFHQTKNVMSGQGGALLINDARWIARAEIIRDRGTNRQEFHRGRVDHYSWVDLGSSFLASDLTAAFLWAQLEDAEAISARRLEIWQQYHAGLADLEAAGSLRRPIVPAHCTHNAHLYYVLLPDRARRDAVRRAMKDEGILAIPHYAPLHTSAAGRTLGKAHGTLANTLAVSERLLRLPLWIDMSPADVQDVLETLRRVVPQTM